MKEYKQLLDIVVSNSKNSGKGIMFINDSDQEIFLSYSHLYERSLKVLRGLQDLNVKPGSELLFQFDDNQIFIEVFWACIMGRIIPVPVTAGSSDEERFKVFKIWRKLKQPYLISSYEILDDIEKSMDGTQEFTSEFEEMKATNINYNQLLMNDGQPHVIESDPDDIAFIQFSSGSTGDPKGVVLTHKNILSNVRAIQRKWALDSTERGLSWMPLTHDMGLIAVHILYSFLNATHFLMPTKLFIRSPITWMEKSHQHKITSLYSPNFGYKYFLAFYERTHNYNWDLSPINHICNGAEPISPELSKRFLIELGKYGLREFSMKPLYGLAEGTVGVSMPPKNELFRTVTLDRRYIGVGQEVRLADIKDANTLTFVDVGYPLESCKVRITNYDGEVVESLTVGNIQIKGESVTAGYYNDAETTQKTIDKDGWLNTGDIGFVYDSRLVVVGREKDVLFVNGTNVFAHDIERVADSISVNKVRFFAACAGMNPNKSSEDVLLFIQFKGKNLVEFNEFAKEVKNHIHNKMNMMIDYVIPVRTIPKTTSGKIQRYKLQNKYNNGEFNSVIKELENIQNSLEPAKGTEDKLLSVCEEVLGKRLDIHDHFYETGKDSIVLTSITERLLTSYGIVISVADLFKYPTISELSCYIDQHVNVNIPSLSMPSEYFQAEGRSVAGFASTINKEIKVILQEISIDYQVDIIDLLIGMFMYLLKEVSNEHIIYIQVSLENGELQSVSIDFTEIATFEELFGKIKTQRVSASGENKLYSISRIESIHGKHENQGMMPIIVVNSEQNNFHKLNEVFDLLIELIKTKEEVSLTCNFNHHLFNEKLIKELFAQYTSLLNNFAQSYNRQTV